MTRYLLRLEAERSATWLLGGTLFGALFGHWVIGLALGALVLLGIHLWYAWNLLVWLDAPKKADLPDGEGIWRLIYDLSIDRYRQARKRKRRLGRIVKEFRASTTALPDAAVVLDEDSQIVWFNQAANELLGLRSGQDTGQRIINLIRHPEFFEYFNQTENAENGVEISAPNDPERTLWVRMIRYGHGQCLLIARDVTERKQTEQSRRDFVANASHELRTPLTVLRGYLDMMASESRRAEELRPWADPIGEMLRQATRMNQIIADLLKLANLEGRGSAHGAGEEVNMPALIGAAMEEAEVLSAGRHRLSAVVDEGLHLQGNISDMQSVVANLLSNALRYTPADGLIELRWESSGTAAVLSVRDSGIGIASQDIPRLTERFYRADEARSRNTGGTGLGLAIVKHALESHHARLQIISAPGKGSEFRCEFPSARVRRQVRARSA